MNVNARNCRWFESRSKVCQMCDSGVDETVLGCEWEDSKNTEGMDGGAGNECWIK